MAAPAAPVVVEGGALAALTGALILACLAWAMLFGIQQFYTYTFGAFSHVLVQALNKIPFAHLGSRTVGQVDDFVQGQIGRALSGAETTVARTWHALGYVARLTAYTVEVLAHATLDAIQAITRSSIPEAVRGAVVPSVSRLSDALLSQSLALARAQLALYARIGGLARDLDEVFGQARAGIDAIRSQAIPALRRELAGVESGLADLRGYAHRNLDRRIGALERRLAPAAIAALAITALSAVAPWVRCSNVGKLGRAVCRSDHNLLESLLAGSLLIIGSISLEAFARDLLEPTELVTTGLEEFVRELRQIG